MLLTFIKFENSFKINEDGLLTLYIEGLDKIVNSIRLLIHLLFNFLTAVEYTIFNKYAMH